MGHTGCASIQDLPTKAKFGRITSQGLRERHVHDVMTATASDGHNEQRSNQRSILHDQISLVAMGGR
jgi:hypothetical protein